MRGLAVGVRRRARSPSRRSTRRSTRTRRRGRGPAGCLSSSRTGRARGPRRRRSSDLEAVEAVEGAARWARELARIHGRGTIALAPSMSPLDDLPADQRAVLQLLLKQGTELRRDRGSARASTPTPCAARAHDALDALGPEHARPDGAAAAPRSPTTCSASSRPPSARDARLPRRLGGRPRLGPQRVRRARRSPATTCPRSPTRARRATTDAGRRTAASRCASDGPGGAPRAWAASCCSAAWPWSPPSWSSCSSPAGATTRGTTTTAASTRPPPRSNGSSPDQRAAHAVAQINLHGARAVGGAEVDLGDRRGLWPRRRRRPGSGPPHPVWRSSRSSWSPSRRRRTPGGSPRRRPPRRRRPGAGSRRGARSAGGRRCAAARRRRLARPRRRAGPSSGMLGQVVAAERRAARRTTRAPRRGRSAERPRWVARRLALGGRLLAEQVVGDLGAALRRQAGVAGAEGLQRRVGAVCGRRRRSRQQAGDLVVARALFEHELQDGALAAGSVSSGAMGRRKVSSRPVEPRSFPAADRGHLRLPLRARVHLGSTTDEVRARSSSATTSSSPPACVHGGVFASMAESMASIATWIAVAAEGKIAMGLATPTSFLRPITDGHDPRRRPPRHRGRTTWVWDVDFTDDEGACATYADDDRRPRHTRRLTPVSPSSGW